jgi:hypothetical protein
MGISYLSFPVFYIRNYSADFYGDLYQNLTCKFNFSPYRSKTSTTLFYTKLLDNFSQKKMGEESSCAFTEHRAMEAYWGVEV